MKIVNEGFVDVYGYKWDKVQCKAYNIASKFIEKLEELHGINPAENSMSEKELEQAKENRHRIYHLPLYFSTRPIVINSNIAV